MPRVLEQDDGGPAFPAIRRVRQFTDEAIRDADLPSALAFKGVEFPGMSLRDYFAGRALAGLCANPGTERSVDRLGADALASAAYVIADLMLRTRGDGEG